MEQFFEFHISLPLKLFMCDGMLEVDTKHDFDVKFLCFNTDCQKRLSLMLSYDLREVMREGSLEEEGQRVITHAIQASPFYRHHSLNCGNC